MPPLDPQRLTLTASLNRVQLVDLPGFAIDPAVRGKTGGQLVSALVLAQLVRQHADNLQLDPNLDDHALRLALDQCFASPDATVRTTVEAIGRRIGRNLCPRHIQKRRTERTAPSAIPSHRMDGNRADVKRPGPTSDSTFPSPGLDHHHHMVQSRNVTF